MNSDQKDTNTDQRLAALEQSVSEMRAQLDDIRAIITSALDAVFAANDKRCHEIDVVSDHINERLDPVFHQVFPQHRRFLAEVDSILRENRG